MKSFTERVKCDLEEQGLHVFRVPRDTLPLVRKPIHLIAMKNGEVTRFIRCSDDGYENLQPRTVLQLKAIGRKCGATVLRAYLNDEDEIIYKKNI